MAKRRSRKQARVMEAEADRPLAEDGSETNVAEATANDKDTEMADALEEVIPTLCSCLCCFQV